MRVPDLEILEGDCLEKLSGIADESVQCCVTSPPYWGLRDYGVEGQMGLEKTPEEYVGKMVEVFREVRRVLREDGTCWLNLGDSYTSSNRGSGGHSEKQDSNKGSWTPANARGFKCDGCKPKDLVGVPWMVAFALRHDGWYLRQDIIWSKPNPMPESVTDRCTKAHEYIFLLTKSARYYYDHEAIKQESVTNDTRRPYGSKGAWELDGRPEEQRHGGEQRSWNGSKFHTGKTAEHQLGRASVNRKRGEFNGKTNELPGREAFRQFTELRNKRSVWVVPTQCYSEAHFATFPPDLIKPRILAGTSARGCCPKCGAPWERVVETDNPSKEANVGYDMTGGAAKTGNPQTSKGLHRNNGGVYSSAKTTGWQPTCDCGEEKTVPCTVLDPFAGSGTTGMVALELGRKAVLIELNPKYIQLIKQRTNVTAGML